MVAPLLDPVTCTHSPKPNKLGTFCSVRVKSRKFQICTRIRIHKLQCTWVKGVVGPNKRSSTLCYKDYILSQDFALLHPFSYSYIRTSGGGGGEGARLETGRKEGWLH